jgi:hypothetical protein
VVPTAHQLVNVIHEAQFHGLDTPHAVQAANGRANLKVLERAIELNAQGSAGTRSAAEDRFLTRVFAAGLPEPLVNQKIEVDFHWPREGSAARTRIDRRPVSTRRGADGSMSPPSHIGRGS